MMRLQALHVRQRPCMLRKGCLPSFAHPSVLRTRSITSRRPQLATAASVNIAGLPADVVTIGAAAAVLLIGSAALFARMSQPTDDASDAPRTTTGSPEQVPRENAVVVFGAAGRLGRLVVKTLLESGRTVVAAVRTPEKAESIFAEMGLTGSSSALIIQQVDVTNKDSLGADLFQGVSQVVISLGPVFGKLAEGGMGYIDNMTSERVEEQGVTNIVSAFTTHVPQQHQETSSVLPMRTSEDLAVWDKLDDVIMGGNSSSGLAPLSDGSGAVWKGDLIVEGGGFCGTRTKKLDLDLSKYDGISMRVRGDGQTFKMNIKTVEQEDVPENTYQATFDTDASGGWTDVNIPWHNFVPVKRAQSDPEGAPLDASQISKFGLVLSRFEFNKMPNPDYKAGPFQLEIEGGIGAYKKERAQIVMVSSAGVERNAIIGDDSAKRQLDIPIVRLNPGGTLNHKYAGEAAVRASGYPYSVIRPTGMSDSADEGPFLLEAEQGDSISGQITRPEVAATIAAALQLPEAAFKTFELRRNASVDSKGISMDEARHLRLFLKLALDKHRWRVGLKPFPRVVPPPAPVTEEEKAKLLADPLVQAAAARDRASRERDAAVVAEKQKEKAAATV